MLQAMHAANPTLTIIGDVCVDLAMGPIGEWPAVGTETIMDDSETRPGGSGGNSALAMQYLGGHYQLISALGSDHFGDWLPGFYTGGDCHFARVDAPTTLSVCLAHACSERTILTTRGHLERMNIDHVLPSLRPAEQSGDTVLLAGVFLLPKLRKAFPQLLAELSQAGYAIAIDTGWPSGGWNDETRAEVRGWLPHCAHLLVNETEALNLAGGNDLEHAMKTLEDFLPPGASVVVKRGREGALGSSGKITAAAQAVAVEVGDSVGAGDTFNTGYLVARLQGRNLGEALQTGCTLASTVIARSPRSAIRPGELAYVFRPGAQAGLPVKTTGRNAR